MEKKEQKKRIAANTLYTMGGLIFMNGVLQLIITPLLNRYMGAKQLGELLYITGLVAIVCPSAYWEAVWHFLCQETVSAESLWGSGCLPCFC